MKSKKSKKSRGNIPVNRNPYGKQPHGLKQKFKDLTQKFKDPIVSFSQNNKKLAAIIDNTSKDTVKTLEKLLTPLKDTRHAQARHAQESFTLDPWQKEAFEALQQGFNVVVDAPTTAGKTRVVEAFFKEYLRKADFRACYTCPVKSLSNDKLKEFREMFGSAYVGIATGDIKENLQAPIVVATLESYRNSLLGIEPDLERKLVVFDEYHFLQDDSRGSAWEESLILTPPNCQILMLSASVGNPEDFTAWLERLSKRPAVLIQVTDRPVPLKNLAFVEGQWIMPELLPPKALPLHIEQRFIEPTPHKLLAIQAEKLLQLKLTPCIIYAGKRASCEQIAEQLANSLPFIDKVMQKEISDQLDELRKEWSSKELLPPNLEKMILNFGIAFHHSGLAPLSRLTVERLIKDGKLRFSSATMGLSLGINFSVKSTLISDAMRPSDFGFTTYPASDILQMTGRAGRRGKDQVGFSCWPSWIFYLKFGQTRREPCYSRLKIDPCTFMGLVSRGYSLGAIENFYKKSFFLQTNAKKNLDLITGTKVSKKLGVKLPCHQPAQEYAKFTSQQNSLCYDCSLRNGCHSLLRTLLKSRLAKLQHHLYLCNAITPAQTLSEFGELSRFFPQSGGMLVASMILRSEIDADSLPKACELFAALSLAHYKSVPFLESYRFPFNNKTTTKALEELYPMELFPELYEQKKGYPGLIIYKEFNPNAGAVIRSWLEDITWDEMSTRFGLDAFGAGDVMALIYRTASYLQSIIQSRKPILAERARELRNHLLRDPLQITL